MTIFLARENSIWNQLIFGQTNRFSNGNDSLAIEETLNETKLWDEKSIGLEYDEKREYEIIRPTRGRCILLQYAAFILLGLYGMTMWTKGWNSENFFTSKHPSCITTSSSNSTESHEVFEVLLPIPDFGPVVYHQQVLSYVFGDSWGKPAIVAYNAPPSDVDFNKVVIELNTTVSGVQYDRLAHLYLDGIPLWRTSTAEPGGSTVYSSVKKDVSEYSNLFKRDGVDFMFQLDNLVTGRLTGAFNVTLGVYYYKSVGGSILPKRPSHNPRVEDIDDEFASSGSVKSFFSTSRPADNIIRVVGYSDQRPPLVYLPTNRLEFTIPKFHANTTRARLNIFTSGNAAEEFWYSNVMDKYTDVFSSVGRTLDGHGPCRIVNVFIDGEKFSVSYPQPVIFTGGISPALWNPIVSNGAFDLRAQEIDLTPLLPSLWESAHRLEIEVSNCLDEVSGSKSSIGQNWITTANILTWEDSQIASSSGDIFELSDSKKLTPLALAPPYSGRLSQIISGKFEAEVSSTLNYTLFNGSEIKVVAKKTSEANISNVMSLKNFGDKQSVVSVGSSKFTFSLVENTEEAEVITDIKTSNSYPLVYNLKETVSDGGEVIYEVSLVTVKSTAISINGKRSISVHSAQNGSSVYHVSPEGNHGYGTIQHRYTTNISSPFPDIYYERDVLAVNRTVVRDDEKIIDTETLEGAPYVPNTETLERGPYVPDKLNLYGEVYKAVDQLISDGVMDIGSISGFDELVVAISTDEGDEDVSMTDIIRVERWATVPDCIRNGGGISRDLTV